MLDANDDRYAIYELEDKDIRATVPRSLGGFKIKGVVQEVYRDIMDGFIYMNVTNKSSVNTNTTFKSYKLQEPTYIKHLKNSVVFVYGLDSEDECNDDELFEELRSASINGGHIDETLEETKKNNQRFIIFEITKEGK